MPDDDYAEELQQLVGDRADRYIPFKEIHDEGGLVTLSSDWDVSELNPFIGIHNAINRGPADSVDLKVIKVLIMLNLKSLLEFSDCD